MANFLLLVLRILTNNLSPKSAFEQLYSTTLTEEDIPASFLPKKRDNTI